MIVSSLLDTVPYIELPYHLLGWVGWFSLAASLLWGLRKKFQLSSSKKFWAIFIVLLFFSIFLPLFFGIKLPWHSSLPLPNIDREAATPAVMFFCAVPWMLAAGMLGFWPSVLLGFISGLISAFWSTHSFFTPLETASLAMVTAYAFRQNYRSNLFQWLRRPLGGAAFAVLACVPICLFTTFFGTNGTLAARLDYCFTQSWMLMLVHAAEILFAGAILDLALVTRSRLWVQFKSFVPSPYETGLQEKVFYIALPTIFVLLLTLSIADWVVAGKAAENMLKSRLKSVTEIAAENIPSLVETGQGLLLDIAGGGIPVDNSEAAQSYLQTKLRSVSFFTQFYLFDQNGNPKTGYPVANIEDYDLTAEEQAGISLALSGVQIQSYVIAPQAGDNAVQIAYIASIPGKGVLAARTNLSVNVFSQPAILAIKEIQSAGGEGVILDADNRILYHTNPGMILTTYQGIIPDNSSYFEDTGDTGSRRLVYASISQDKGWKILLSLPASAAQDLALQIAIPLLAISILISLGAYLLLRFMVGSLSKSLEVLANQADKIASGSLDQKIEVRGVDEIGRLSSEFEQMRASLKARLDELDVLFEVSKGIASDFEISKTAVHLLKACLSYGADSARLILKNGYSFGFDEESIVFSAGREGDEYAELDEYLLDQLGTDKILVIPSKSRIKRTGSSKSTQIPSAVAALALADDKSDLGMMWIAYTEPHRFYDEEVSFLNTIAGQAVLAISNSSLFMSAEVGKRRLESVLASTPEPVLVIGESGRLLMANGAAEKVNGLIAIRVDETHPVGEIASYDFMNFIRLSRERGYQSGEIQIEGKTYEIRVSPVMVENILVGTVSVLRDITEYRELDKMKSDFVATVSHDLRAPMGIVRGYATMLQMVGELNDQQKDYAAKIINDLDIIDQMVGKLLDLGRIESGSVLQIEKLSPAELITEAMRVLQPIAAQRKVKFISDFSIGQNLEIEADKALLHQALYNLLDNAIKFSPLGGKVELRLQASLESVIFEIQDHGQGIAPLDLPKIFDRFNRSGIKEDTALKGSGLGLSIVKSVAERHRGKAWATSTLGKGSTFFLEIPIFQSDHFA